MNRFIPSSLRCESVVNPIGVHAPRPLLSWTVDTSHPGARQSAYRVAAASSLAGLTAGAYDLWDTGRVERDLCIAIPYSGKPLSSARRAWWRVWVWDERGKLSAPSAPAFFEMGLLSPDDWHGRWMGFLGGMIGCGILLRQSFTLPKKPVGARAYIACAGYYELRLNGGKVGDKLIDPGPTDTSKTVLYSAYDVLESLREGLNVVGIQLGTGWAGMPKALLQLNIRFEDGSTQEVVTDWGIGWCVAAGPITMNSIYDGEDYDARLEKPGWDTPEYQDTFLREHQKRGGWTLSTIVEAPGGELIGEISEPVRVTGTAEPAFVRMMPDGGMLFDVGVNQTGWVRMKVLGARGARVRLTFAEVLTETGDLDLSYLRSARCQDSYTLKGNPAGEEYAPRFTYHGFRYFSLESEGEVAVRSVVMEFARSDLRKNATFECSDPFLNRLAQVMWHTDACNLFGIPTDCCQRDERHGWTTDTTSRAEVSTYHFDMAAFFEKWLRDVMDTQDERGYFADTAPHRWGRRPCDPQVNTPVSLPLLLYKTYGNRRAVEENFDRLKRYMAVLAEESDDLMLSRTGFGEWACPKADCYDDPYGAGAVSRHVNPALVSTGYFFLSLTQMAEMARILGREADEKEFSNLAERVRARYNAAFFRAGEGDYDTGSQSSNALSIDLGLAAPERIPSVIESIVRDVRAKGVHMATGNMGTKALVEVLSRAGEDDLCCELMAQRTSPSFGYMLDMGATSIWERWEADRDNNIMNSRNQPMLAASGVWFYKYLGGIRLAEDSAGGDSLVIEPHAPTRLSWAKTSVNTPLGEARVHWTREGGAFSLYVKLPFNTRAEIRIKADYARAGAALTLDGAPVQAWRDGAWWGRGRGLRRVSLPIGMKEHCDEKTDAFKPLDEA